MNFTTPDPDPGLIDGRIRYLLDDPKKLQPDPKPSFLTSFIHRDDNWENDAYKILDHEPKNEEGKCVPARRVGPETGHGNYIRW